MDLKQLEHLVAVCDAGSFSGAVKRLRISPPTLSKSIARLEGKVGGQSVRSDQSQAPETRMALAADHQVVMDGDAQRLGRRLDLARHLDVVA